MKKFLKSVRELEKFIQGIDKKVKWRIGIVISLLTIGIPTAVFYHDIFSNDNAQLVEYEEYLSLQNEWAESVRNKDFGEIDYHISKYEGDKNYINLYLLYKGSYEALLASNFKDLSIYFLKIDNTSYFYYDAIMMLNQYYKKYCCDSLWEEKMDKLINNVELASTQIHLLNFLKRERFQKDKGKLQENYKNLKLIYQNHFNFSDFSFKANVTVGDKLDFDNFDSFTMPPTLAYLYLQNLFNLSVGIERQGFLNEIKRLIASKKSNIDRGLGQFWLQDPFIYPINYEIVEPPEGTVYLNTKVSKFQVNESIFNCAEMYYVRSFDKKLLSRGRLNKSSVIDSFSMSIDHNSVDFILADRFQIISKKRIVNYWSKYSTKPIQLEGACSD